MAPASPIDSFSDDDFEFDDLDSAALNELAAIEATHTATSARPATPQTTANPPARRGSRLEIIQQQLDEARQARPANPVPILKPTASRTTNNAPLPRATTSRVVIDAPHASSEIYDVDSFEINDDLFQGIDLATNAALAGKPLPPRTFTRQTTLTGEILPVNAGNPKSTRTPNQRTSSSSNPFGKASARTKYWDHTAFAKTGIKTKSKTKSKAKGKGGQYDDEEEEEEIEFPVPFVPLGPPPPMRVQCDLEAAREWVYPLNHPKRDYQFNIVRKALFQNTLVALPTGLGKTFIAGVVMLNYYRWFPRGRIVFLAPTKPLVAQQIEASHQTCGIPGSDAVELTGQVPTATRARHWASKRVFYMTPQTFINDLTSGVCNCEDIVLIVVDEAHRGTGDYAYCTVVRFMMAKNPHFRMLALTATPGSNGEAVQAIVDSMHISHIEIRDERALDLKDYVHKKHMIQHCVELTEDAEKIRDALVKLMEKVLKPIHQFLPGVDVATMNDYRCTAKLRDLRPNERWASGPLMALASLARAMTYFLAESVEMCYNSLIGLMNGVDNPDGTKTKRQVKLASDPLFQAVLREIERQKALAGPSGLIVHPKVDMLKALLLAHFSSLDAEEVGGVPAKGAKVMVFASYRDAVEEIVEHLNLDSPLIRAHRFVGQGKGKDGKGLTQKEQLHVIEQFKSGEFNTLVCTSIGEEGLDIGEVDLIVCYDSHKAPIKMLQRIGRTGRKKDGHIAVLVAPGKEEENFQKAKDQYADVQRVIVRGEQLELYADVERLIPDDIKPQVCEKVMPIEGYNKEGAKGRKRKRDDGLPKSVPAGETGGFVTAGALVKKGRQKKAPPPPRVEIGDDDDDEDDEELEDLDAWLAGKPVAKKSKPTPPGKKAPKKKATTAAATKKKASSSKKTASSSTKVSPRVSSPRGPLPGLSSGFTTAKSLLEMMGDDGDDEDQGMHDADAPSDDEAPPPYISPKAKAKTKTKAVPNPRTSPQTIEISSSPEAVLSDKAKCKAKARPSIVDISPSPSPEKPFSPVKVARGAAGPSTPPLHQRILSLSPSSPVFAPPPQPFEEDSSWLLGSSDDDDAGPSNMAAFPRPRVTSSDDAEENRPPLSIHKATSRIIRRPLRPSNSADSFTTRLVSNMGPPAARPANRSVIEIDTSVELLSPDKPRSISPSAIQSTFPVRPAGRRQRPARVVASDSSPSRDISPPPRRVQSPFLSSPELAAITLPTRRLPKTSSRRRPVYDRNNGFVAMEADHSGDEIAGGGSDSEGEEDSYDREFIGAGLTQAPEGYDQSAIYRQGLFTQAPSGLEFKNKPVRGGYGFFVGGAGPSRGGVADLSSSPRQEGSEPDEYEMGSFVVGDDEELL